MSNIILAVVLLGGCLLMHLLMMRKGGHFGSHGSDVEDGNKEEKKDKHGGCCH
ncbi:MAG: hypothetical protein WAV15_03395 [Minisyncoccia bacterium]